MKFTRRSELYKRVQQIAWGMMTAAQARGDLRGWQGPCVDCGTSTAWAYRDDHRDYSEPLKIETVCASCNGRRGPALLMLFNVETAVWEQISPKKVTHA